jgi:hypothetical protein
MSRICHTPPSAGPAISGNIKTRASVRMAAQRKNKHKTFHIAPTHLSCLLKIRALADRTHAPHRSQSQAHGAYAIRAEPAVAKATVGADGTGRAFPLACEESEGVRERECVRGSVCA